MLFNSMLSTSSVIPVVACSARVLDMIYLFVPRTFLRDSTIYATGRSAATAWGWIV